MEITVKDLMDRYGIKQSTAYKWRTFLRENNLPETYESYDKIHTREYNLSSALVLTDETMGVTQTNDEVSQTPLNHSQMIGGLSVGRLQELNAQVELEVAVEEKLRDYHRSQRQSKRASELHNSLASVSNMSPDNLGELLQAYGIGA